MYTLNWYTRDTPGGGRSRPIAAWDTPGGGISQPVIAWDTPGGGRSRPVAVWYTGWFSGAGYPDPNHWPNIIFLLCTQWQEIIMYNFYSELYIRFISEHPHQHHLFL